MSSVTLWWANRRRTRSSDDGESEGKIIRGLRITQQTADEPLLPDEMCANEAERHTWCAGVLAFIHDHIDSAEVYRLGEADLAFAELLPRDAAVRRAEEYEERTSVGLQLERLTKGIGAVTRNAP